MRPRVRHSAVVHGIAALARTMSLIVLGALPASAPFAAPPSMSDYAEGVVLDTGDVVAGPRPLIQLTLPDLAYEATTTADLSDLRVFNADGAAAPHALCPADDSQLSVMVEAALPIFVLQEARGASSDRARIEVQTREGTQIYVQEGDRPSASASPVVGAHVIDARSVKETLNSIQFDWISPDGDSEVRVQIEASEDLDRWNTVVASSTLLAVGQGNASLQRREIELPRRHYRYLRVERADGGPALAISRVIARAGGDAIGAEPVWFAARDARSTQPDTRAFLSTRLAPVQYARLRMPLDNSSLHLTLQSRKDEKSPWTDRWRGETYLYVNEGERRESPPATFAPTRDRFWRVSLPGNANAASIPPMLELGYYPAKLRFLAQGPEPYTLAVGSRRAESAPAVPCDGLLANISPEEREKMTGMAYPGPQRVLGGERALQPLPRQTPTRMIVLWGVLVVGVGLLVAMALSLLKRVRPDGSG